MIEGIGTTWMHPPKSNPDKTEKPIWQMDMSELRSMMCAKSNGQTEACEKCPGFKNCPVGQRAVRLKSEATRENEVWDRELFQAACESGNAWNYLMVKQNLGKDAAGELLSKMIRKFPGMAADYGGGRRIMQRPRAARIAPVGAQETPVAAPEVKAEQEEALKPEAAGTAKKQLSEAALQRNVKGAAANRDKAREVAKAAFAYGDPIAWLEQNEGSSRMQALARVRSWIKRYPDIAGDYKSPETIRKKRSEPAPAKEEAQMENTDEISLADFLEEHAETKPEITPEEPTGIMKELNEKYDTLKAEKQRLEERIKWITEQQEALVKVASMFGERAQMYAEENTETRKQP